MDTDQQFLESLKAGDASAWEALYQRYLPLIWRQAWHGLHGDRHAVEDVVSDTFLAAVQGVKTLSLSEPLIGPWLLGIVRHKITDAHRARGRAVPARPIEQIDGNVSPQVDRPDISAVTQEQRNQVVEALSDMPDIERIVLEWKYIEKLSVRQIAQRTQSTEKATESLLFRARAALRKKLSKHFGQGVLP